MTTRSRNHGESEIRYRLNVLAPHVLDAVNSVGGWLFDCAMAGWDVTVMVRDHDDPRALQILGAEVLDLAPALSSWERRPHPQSIAVAAELFDRDARVRERVLRALEHGLADVALWGEHWPAELGRGPDEMRHELTSAASVFKSEALAATHGLQAAPVGRTEVLRCGTVACVGPLPPWRRGPRHRTA